MVIEQLTRYGIPLNRVPELKLGLISASEMPRLKKLSAKTEWLALPFYYAGAITHIGLYDVITDRLDRIVLSDLPGVFLEPQMRWPAPSTVIMCKQEMDALLLYSKFTYTGGTNRMTPVCCSRHDCLSDVSTIQELCLLSAPHCRLNALEALSIWRSHRNMNMTVMDANVSLLTSAGFELERVQRASKSLWSWLIAALLDSETTAEQIGGLGLSGEEIEAVTRILRQNLAPVSLINLFNSNLSNHTERVICGTRIVRKNDGYYELRERPRKLTDFTLHVESYLDTDKGKAMRALLYTNVPDEKPLTVTIPFKILTSNICGLCNFLWEETLGKTQCKFIGEQLSERLDWLTILRQFDNAPYLSSMVRLGVYNNVLSYPKFSLDMNTSMLIPSHGVVGLNPYITTMWDKLVPGIGSLSCFSQLLQSKSAADLILAGILGHIVHEIGLARKLGSLYRPRHLIVTEDMGTYVLMTDVYTQLFHAVGSHDDIPTLSPNSSVANKMRALYKELHELPAFCRITKDSDNFSEMLNGATGPLIILADQVMSAKMARRNNCEYIISPRSRDGLQMLPLDEGKAEEAVAALPLLLQTALSTNYAELTRSDVTSAAHGVRRIVGLLNITPHSALYTLFTKKPIVSQINTPLIFLLELWRMANRERLFPLKRSYDVKGVLINMDNEDNVRIDLFTWIDKINKLGYGFTAYGLKRSMLANGLFGENKKWYLASQVRSIMIQAHIWEKIEQLAKGSIETTADANAAVNQ